MEMMLHYVWQHKIFPLKELTTIDGMSVEVISPGMHNTDAGPDFLNAKVKIGGMLWVGSVEVHLKSSDWFRHHHDTDEAYNSVVLHVTADADCSVTCQSGAVPHQLVLAIPDYVRQNYNHLQQSDQMPPCHDVVGELPRLTVHNWMSRLFVERLEVRTEQIMQRRELCNKNWEDTMFVTMARNFGFGINGQAFEQWAYSIPMSAVAKHRNDLMQVEAIFFGQAGLLSDEVFSDEMGEKVSKDMYFQQLKNEYTYLQHKFSLHPISPTLWRFLRLRPQNFPHVRIAQLAMLYHEGRVTMSSLMNATDIGDLFSLLTPHVSPYWRTHYTFAHESTATADKQLTKSSKSLLVINSVAPMLFAYGKYKSDEKMQEHALSLFEHLPSENNRFIRDWCAAGVACESAADSQAIIHLTREYCQKHNCLRCRFGYEYISRTPGFLKEEQNL